MYTTKEMFPRVSFLFSYYLSGNPRFGLFYIFKIKPNIVPKRATLIFFLSYAVIVPFSNSIKLIKGILGT